MKKIIILTVAVLYGLAGMASGTTDSWVISAKGKMNCKKVSIGISKARIVLENGERMAVPLNQINSYSVDNKTFNKMMLYKKGKPTGRMEFMELVKTSSDLSLYRYDHWNYDAPLPFASVTSYFIYNGDKLHLELNEETFPTVCRFFGLQANYR